jgi:hypothetical protein
MCVTAITVTFWSSMTETNFVSMKQKALKVFVVADFAILFFFLNIINVVMNSLKMLCQYVGTKY